MLEKKTESGLIIKVTSIILLFNAYTKISTICMCADDLLVFLGERGEEWRPILLGMKSETIKCEILDQAKGLQNTIYKDVGIGPDQTKQQKQAEIRLKEEADRMNREELNDQDKAKNLKWAVIGPRGEKRIVKIQDREDREGSRGPPTRGGRGRGRGRGTWNNDRTGDRSKRGRQEEDRDTEMERPRSRTKQ